MPKARRDRSVSFDRPCASPFRCCSSRSRRSLPKNPLESEDNVKEWEEARCPACMEHPHNAILLICSSHEKGCRPFMCDTSYRHSNCFDQFKKSFSETQPSIAQQEETPLLTTPALSSPTMVREVMIPDLLGERSEEGSTSMSCENQEKSKLVCPLCRGQINGWIIVESARLFMNTKSRSCACETCDFSGTYADLRKHARSVHPLVRPSEADPERERDWRRLERHRDLGDLISTLQSSIVEETREESSLSFDEGAWLTVFLLIRVYQPDSSRSSRRRVTVRRSRRATPLWGEAYDGDSRDDDNESSDGGSVSRTLTRRSRRRPTPEEL